MSKAKDDILLTPRNFDQEKLMAKEMEWTKKWRNMAAIERPNGMIYYCFPMSRKVRAPLKNLGVNWSLVHGTFKGIPDC